MRFHIYKWPFAAGILQAERQAVNTTVQGSAADLVKKAMILIDQQLHAKYPGVKPSHRHKNISIQDGKSVYTKIFIDRVW